MKNREIDLTIFGNTYIAKFPNVGQFIDIQTIKAKLTEDKYETFKLLSRDGLFATIFCDTIATFNVIIPQLQEDLNKSGLLDLDLDKMIELSMIYKDHYLPFYEKVMGEINSKEEAKQSKEAVSESK